MASSSSWSFLSIAKRGARSCWMDLGSHGTASAMGQRGWQVRTVWKQMCKAARPTYGDEKHAGKKGGEEIFVALDRCRHLWSKITETKINLITWVDMYMYTDLSLRDKYRVWKTIRTYPWAAFLFLLWALACKREWSTEGTSINHGSNISYRTCLASSAASLPALTLFQTHHDLTINSGSQHACHDNRNREKSLMMIRCTV